MRIIDILRNYHLHPDLLITHEIAGKSTLITSQRLCIFAHYDGHNLVQPYVLYYLSELVKNNCAIIFVSACSELEEHEIKKVLPFCSKIILKKNLGLDFGSWFIGLQKIVNLSNYQQIIFANDSVYGPLFDLKEVFEQMNTQAFDVWGITDSWQHAYHLQSYFLVVNDSAIHHPFFREFWQSFRFINNKYKIIENYEIGFSQKALQHQLSIGGYCNYFDVYAKKKAHYSNETYKKYFSFLKDGVSINPAHTCWDVLIHHFRCPFIKKELLCINPTKVPNIETWPSVIKQYTNYEIALIHDSL